MSHLIRKFLYEENGATAIEYVMIAAGIALASIVTIYSIGDEINEMLPETVRSIP